MRSQGEIFTEVQPAFDLDGMLGRLAKWLRILGFDAAWPCPEPRAGRIFVTACGRKLGVHVLIVHGADALEQLRLVLTEADAVPKPELFLSRCIRHNALLRKVSPGHLEGRVPEPIRAALSEFNECPECGKIYWQGSHEKRMRARLETVGLL